jgi:hypothetical protein
MPWSPITGDEVRPSAFAFHRVHAECGVMVHIERGSSSLVCWCERCRDSRAYEINNGRARRARGGTPPWTQRGGLKNDQGTSRSA